MRRGLSADQRRAGGDRRQITPQDPQGFKDGQDPIDLEGRRELRSTSSCAQVRRGNAADLRSAPNPGDRSSPRRRPAPPTPRHPRPTPDAGPCRTTPQRSPPDQPARQASTCGWLHSTPRTSTGSLPWSGSDSSTAYSSPVSCSPGGQARRLAGHRWAGLSWPPLARSTPVTSQPAATANRPNHRST
jgi:hypothetical protein